MTLLLSGLALFVAIHVLPTIGGTRAALVARLGEMPWKLVHSLVTVAALVLIVLGWKRAPTDLIYAPPDWGRAAVFVLMLPVLYLLIGRRIGTNLKRFTAHPMLWAIVLWAAAHLLANGERRAVLLFGAFAAYGLFAMWSQDRRGVAKRATESWPWSSEFRAFAVTIAVYAALVAAHQWLSGVRLF
jgi:uncharacterized membrane protein